ncbi:MAG TPA: plastocyanin/azurin family copper-binding protein [Acidimicrobiia bacterium]|nr:plastocyanin/azurin family copper-binding protein [Acidimicrobiia bacterium]
MSGLLRRGGATAVVTGVLAAGLIGLIPAAVPPASGATAQVLLGEMRFNPSRLEIALGDSVRWEAVDEGHTVTAADGSFDSSPRGLMGEGDEYRYRFRVPGTYAYFCRVHANRGMRGAVTVVDPNAPTTSSTRVTPVTAAAPTPTTAAASAPATLTTEPPTTTTSRRLATSSSTSPAMATASTAPVGTALIPQEPPALNPSAPVVSSAEGDADLPGAQAAARRTAAEDDPLLLIAVVAVAALALFGGFVGVRARRSRPSA